MREPSFIFAPSVSSNDHQVRVIVDGRDILESINKTMLGLDPPEFFKQSALRASGELLIGRCECGCIGCCDAIVEATRTETQVVWCSSYPGLKEITFDLVDFDRAIEAGSHDTSWETLDRRVERLVKMLDFSPFARRGMLFQWASTRFDQETIRLSFSRGDRQELLSVPWDHRNELTAIDAVRDLIRRQAPSRFKHFSARLLRGFLRND